MSRSIGAGILVLYVDDIIFGQGNNEGQVRNVLRGGVNTFLDMDIPRSRSTGVLLLQQRKYINVIMKRFYVAECNPAPTPGDGLFPPTGTTLDLGVPSPVSRTCGELHLSGVLHKTGYRLPCHAALKIPGQANSSTPINCKTAPTLPEGHPKPAPTIRGWEHHYYWFC
ncbi:unnamed protein product [Discosporangium mesarthrocarpum]